MRRFAVFLATAGASLISGACLGGDWSASRIKPEGSSAKSQGAEGYAIREPIVIAVSYIASASGDPGDAACPDPKPDFHVQPREFSNIVARSSTLLAMDFVRRLSEVALRVNPKIITMGNESDPTFAFKAVNHDFKVILVPLRLEGTRVIAPPSWIPEEIPTHFSIFLSAWSDPCLWFGGAFNSEKLAVIEPIVRVRMNPALGKTFNSLILANQTAMFVDETDILLTRRNFGDIEPTWMWQDVRDKNVRALAGLVSRKPADPARNGALKKLLPHSLSSGRDDLEFANILPYGKGRVGDGLVVLPDTDFPVTAEGAFSTITAEGFELAEMIYAAVEFLERQNVSLASSVEARFETSNTSISDARRDFSKVSWKAETDWLVKNVTYPIMAQWFDVDLANKLGPIGNSFKVMIEAEHQAQGAAYLANAAAATAGVAMGNAQRNGDAAGAFGLFQSGMDTANSAKGNIRAKVEVSQAAGAAQNEFLINAGQREFKISASTHDQLHGGIRSVYFSLEGGSSGE